MKRYFILFYTAQGKKGEGQGVGHICATTDGNYLQMKDCIKQVENVNDVVKVTITNIIELNESDYNDWIS